LEASVLKGVVFSVITPLDVTVVILVTEMTRVVVVWVTNVKTQVFSVTSVQTQVTNLQECVHDI
jgi:hypothetical protein